MPCDLANLKQFGLTPEMRMFECVEKASKVRIIARDYFEKHIVFVNERALSLQRPLGDWHRGWIYEQICPTIEGDERSRSHKGENTREQ